MEIGSGVDSIRKEGVVWNTIPFKGKKRQLVHVLLCTSKLNVENVVSEGSRIQDNHFILVCFLKTKLIRGRCKSLRSTLLLIHILTHK